MNQAANDTATDTATATATATMTIPRTWGQFFKGPVLRDWVAPVTKAALGTLIATGAVVGVQATIGYLTSGTPVPDGTVPPV